MVTDESAVEDAKRGYIAAVECYASLIVVVWAGSLEVVICRRLRELREGWKGNTGPSAGI